MLGKLLSEKWAIATRQDREIVKAGYGGKRAAYGLKKKFWFYLILNQTLKFKHIIKMNPDLMVFFLKITFLKQFKKVHTLTNNKLPK